MGGWLGMDGWMLAAMLSGGLVHLHAPVRRVAHYASWMPLQMDGLYALCGGKGSTLIGVATISTRPRRRDYHVAPGGVL